jgi:hypothetical protein
MADRDIEIDVESSELQRDLERLERAIVELKAAVVHELDQTPRFFRWLWRKLFRRLYE